jgi:hypothetical protein
LGLTSKRIFPSDADTPVRSLQVDAIRARLITCETQNFAVLQQADQVAQALAELSHKRGVSSAPPNMVKVYEVAHRLASDIKRRPGQALVYGLRLISSLKTKP